MLSKKLKKKLLKKLENVKEFAKDQKHYLKTCANSVKNVLVLTAKITMLTSSMLLLSLSADTLHKKYIESKIGNSTVFIKSPQGAEHQGTATGFEIRAKSGKIYTLTNAHVCGLQKDGVIMIEDKLNSHRFIPKRVIEVYEDNDLCLVEGMDNYQALELADNLDVGDLVTSVGYPMGGPMNVSSGRVKNFDNVEIIDSGTKPEDCIGKHKAPRSYDTIFGAMNVCVIERYAVETDVTTFPGNSGSPLVNIYGNVVGIVFASNNQTHWGDAVPLFFIKDLLKAY